MKPIEEYTTDELCVELSKRSGTMIFGCVNQLNIDGHRDIATYISGEGKELVAILVRLAHRIGGDKMMFEEVLDYMKRMSVYLLWKEDQDGFGH